MIKDKEVIYTTAECLQQSVGILKALGDEYDWNDNKEFIRQLYMLSTIGYILTHDEYKQEMVKFFTVVGKRIKENNDIIKQAKRYAEFTKD